MAKREYTGLYLDSGKTRPLFRACTANVAPRFRYYSTMISSYASALYSTMSGNYVLIVTVFFVMMLTFLLPDISQKFHAAQELKGMKAVLDQMTSEVKQAEVSCLAVADKICCIHCTMQDSTTDTTKKMRELPLCTSHCMRTTQSEPSRFQKNNSFYKRIFSSNKNTSHKEVAIMSYVYTDSFDAHKPNVTSSQ